jgi:hypothetical protein
MVEFNVAYNCVTDFGAGSFEEVLPRWTRPVLLPRGWETLAPQPCTQSRILTARGWPLPALWSAVEVDIAAGGYRTLAGIRVTDSWPGFGARPWKRDPPVTLPTRPRWPGFLLDSTLFAAAWWLLGAIPRRVRGALRRRRGRCPRCAYDLRGLLTPTCPECGVPTIISRSQAP